MSHQTETPVESELTLPSDLEIKLARSFRAPRDLLWRAYTDPKLIPRWLGYADQPMTRCDMDLRVGGAFRWTWDLGGSELNISGRFLAVDPPKKLVTTENLSDDPDAPGTHNIMTFVERHGRTTLTILIKAPDKETRDMILSSGMKEGVDASYRRLDDLLEDLA